MAKEKSSGMQEVRKQKAPAVSVMHNPSPFEEMDRLFESYFGHAWPRIWLHPFRWERPHWPGPAMPFGGYWPRVDIIDRDNELVVRIEVPGVNKEDLDVSMTDNTVTIRGTTATKKEEKKNNYYRSETSQGEFTRTVALPCDVDGGKVKAKLDNGILELNMPKMEKAKRKNVTIE